jgi:transposase
MSAEGKYKAAESVEPANLAKPCGQAPTATPEHGDRAPAPPRLRTANRQQLLPAITIDQLLEPDHPARDVWRYVERLDLAVLYDAIRAREGRPGRTPIDPRLLVAVWLYAYLCGFTSARELAGLCREYNSFRWLMGDLHVNYHTLSDFLVGHLDFLEQLFTHSVDVLRSEGLVDLDRVAQDGMRVRACAGAASFRRRATLEKLLQQAQQEVQRLQQQLAKADEEAPSEVPEGEEVATASTDTTGAAKKPAAQQRAAQQRAAEERLARLQQAQRRLPEMEAKKEPKDKEKARVSTTDPEATNMKMADGGFRPAYNIQYSTTCTHQIIVGVDVVTVGSDQGQLPPMLDQIAERFGQRPKEALVDGGFVNHHDLEVVQQGEEDKGSCKVYAPVPKPKKEEVDRHAPHEGDSKEVSEWRQRMGTDAAKEIYKQRAATAECVNAQARNRGLVRLLVRGLQKVKAVAFWLATVHNMARSFALLPPLLHSTS